MNEKNNFEKDIKNIARANSKNAALVFQKKHKIDSSPKTLNKKITTTSGPVKIRNFDPRNNQLNSNIQKKDIDS